MDNQAAAECLATLGDLIELTEDQPFKARAYHQAARTLKGLSEPGEHLYRENRITELPGIGKALAEKLGELYNRGTIGLLEELKARVPPGVLDLRRVPGLGAKKVRLLYREHGIESLEQLKGAAADGSLLKISGFGARSVERLLDGIAQIESFAGYWRWPRAERFAENMMAGLLEHWPQARIESAGDLRRNLEVIGRMAWVVVDGADDPAFVHWVRSLPECQRCETETGVIRLRLGEGVKACIYRVPPEESGRALLQATGPDDYAQFVLDRAGDAVGNEEALLAAAGLPWLPPECRDSRDWWTTGAPEPRLADADLRGVLHCHSTYSDGHATIAEMARACQERGYSYLGICDHSRSAAYAGGLSIERVAEQHREIDELNLEFDGRFRIFKGIESDILPDGSLDYPDEVLGTFDFVVASIHSGLVMDEARATGRICRALANPYVTMLGHPTGRLLLMRRGYPLDWSRIIASAAEHGVILELNANPRRLDTDWRILRDCFSAGVRTSINPDAHRPEGIDDMRYGVAVARKAGTTRDDVLNTMETADLARYLEARRP